GLSPLNTGESVMPPSAPMVNEEMQMSELMSLVLGADESMIGKLKLEKAKEKAIITINEKILFHKGRIKLLPSSFPLLNKLCDLFKKGDYQIEIIGHTDNIPAEAKGYSSNWEISTLMATQVLKYFVTEGDISPQRLTAYGCGSNISIASNDTIASRTQNRRINVVLHFKAPEYVKRIHREKPSGIFTYKKFDFRISE
ncbi:MAG: OmpA family protein, partial [Thermodesulfobacteriota bacterium]|nr:OmpA family protein [Thermodesulfobacteriota bacterium]